MKCPLHVTKESVYKDGIWQGVEWKFIDCIEDKCAWWDRENLDCSIRVIARSQHIIRSEGFKLTFKEGE